MILRLARRLTTADALGLMLVLAALSLFTSGVAASLPNTDTKYFFWIGLIVMSVSYGMGKKHIGAYQASAGMVALGIVFVWILGARLTQPLLILLDAVLSTLNQIIPAIQTKTSIDATAILEAWAAIVEASRALAARLQVWLSGLNRNVTVNDALARNMIWVLILWLFSAWMGWFAEKRKAAAALLPALLLLGTVTSYSEHKYEFVWGMVIVLLVLMGIWNYKNHTLVWQKGRMDYSDSIRIDISQSVVYITLLVGALAFITPSISWRDVVDYIRERGDKNEAAEMLGIQQPRVSGKPTSQQTPSLPRDHLLTGGFANSEKIVMTIRTGELPPVPVEMLPSPAPRYYWRSAVYDQYVGTGWVTSAVTSQSISANTPLIPGLLSGYRIVDMNVQMIESEGRLFWSGTLFSADIPFTAAWRLRPTSDLFADQSALLQSDLFAASSRANAYQAETYVPAPTISDLRSASTDYPAEIRERYLQLPRDLPERVHALARDITGGIENPYEKAKAIESYLRTNYPYDLEVPAPPSNEDVAEYFLFELKKGYCDYYASAMVVLARSRGLPARFVSGYSPGSYDAPNAQYVIRELNAHSWVEIYFPEIGWIEFEPTASLPEIERPDMELILPEDQSNQASASELITRLRLERILLWLSPLIGAVVFALAYFAFLERWLYLRLDPATAIHRIYQNFYRAGRPLAGEWTRAETSSEYLSKIIDEINEIEERRKPMNVLKRIKNNAVTLTALYHRSLFIDYQAQKQDARIAWRIWTRLRRQLFFARIFLHGPRVSAARFFSPS